MRGPALAHSAYLNQVGFLASLRLDSVEGGVIAAEANRRSLPPNPRRHSRAVFGARAAALNRLIFKGSKVAVEGKLRHESWQASDGTRRSRLRVVVADVELMSPRGAFGSSGGSAQATDPAHDPVRNGGHETEPYAESFARGGSQQTSAQPVYAAPAPSSRQQTPPRPTCTTRIFPSSIYVGRVPAPTLTVTPRVHAGQ